MIKYVSLEKFTIIILLILSIRLFAQSNWQYQWTLPTTNHLFEISFPTPDTGYAVGDFGSIIKTIDKGETWLHLNSGVSSVFSALYFCDTELGYAAGEEGIILKTTDGGTSWQTLETGYYNDIYSLYFLSPDTGFAVGWFDGVLKTFDGGESWEYNAGFYQGNTYHEIYFINSRLGFVVGGAGFIYRTKDGGATWEKFNSDAPSLFSVNFYDENIGLAGSRNGIYMKTIDGGDNWTIYYSPIANDFIPAIEFISADTVVMVGNTVYDGGHFLISYDGGYSWYYQDIEAYDDMAVVNGREIHLVGSKTAITCSPDLGQTWEQQSEYHSEKLYAIDFLESNVGIAVGLWGKVIKTTDGQTWQDVADGYPNHMYGIDFNSRSVGLIVGVDGILRSADSGESWSRVYYDDELVSVDFVSDDVAYAAGDYGACYKSTNSGVSWQTINVPNNWDVRTIKFLSPDHGFISCGSNIYKTKDGGVSWYEVNGITKSVNEINFPTSSVGYCVSGGGYIAKTCDGGDNWTTLAQDLTTLTFRAVRFSDENRGIVVGNDGTILYTSDGGTTWGMLPNFSNADCHSIALTDENEWYICGDYGLLLYSGNCGGLLSIDNNIAYTTIPTERLIHSAYPNPFNSSITVDYVIPFKGFIDISVYDITGREIVQLVNSDMSTGKHSLQWNPADMASGLYIITLKSRDSFETKKVTLVK